MMSLPISFIIARSSSPKASLWHWCLCWLAVACVSPAAVLGADPGSGEFLLVRRSLVVQPIRQVTINDQTLEYLNNEKGWATTRIADCIALLNPAAAILPPSAGLLVLVDGQRIPGAVAIDGVKPQPDLLAWEHPWLGRMDVPLKLIESIQFAAEGSAPPAAQQDIIVFANGDRQEGFITAIGKSISLEVNSAGQKRINTIPLNLVSALTMVSPKQTATGRRVWFADGTVVDVKSFTVGADGYVHLGGSSLASGTPPSRIGLAQIAGVLFDPKCLTPLASLAPSRLEGPATRYVLPKPRISELRAALGLSSIELQGPIIVRYTLPAPEGDPGKTARHLVAEASLPADNSEWGDCELVIRSNDEEVFRSRLNAANPLAAINVAIPGRELTIELTAGANGPIQDHVILSRAMLLGK